MTKTIAVAPPPKDDETLTSWVNRIAAANLMPLSWVLKAAGWTSSNHHTDTPTGYGIVLTPDQTRGLSRVTGVPSDRITAMVPTTWIGSLARGTDPREHDISQDARRFALHNWIYTTGSHYCPQCLDQSDGAWQLKWKSPFTFACLTHHTLLSSHCSACGHRADYGRLDGSSRPAFPKTIPQPGHCHNPMRQSGHKQERGPCLHNLTTDPASGTPPAVILNTQNKLLTTRQPFEYWNDLRALTAYTLAVHTTDDAEHLLGQRLPDDLRAAWTRQHQQRTQRQAENRQARKEGVNWRTRSQDTTGRKPPTDTTLLAAAVTIAHRAYTDDDHFTAFIQRGRDNTHATPGSRLSNLKASPSLTTRARDAHIGERKTLLDSGLLSRYTTPTTRPVNFNPDHLPPYLWPDIYEQRLAHIFEPVAVTDRTARKFAIIALYRSATGTTWATATGAFLDGAIKSPRTAYAVLSALKNSQQGDLRQTALITIADIAAELTHDQVETYHATRQWADKHIRRPVPYDTYRAALPKGQLRHTTQTSRLNAAVWLWSQHTLADRIDAPAWQTTPTDTQLEQYRFWCTTTAPETKTELLEWAKRKRPREGT